MIKLKKLARMLDIRGIVSYLLIFQLIMMVPTQSLLAVENGDVVSGSANINQNGNLTNVDVFSDKTVINWDSFDTTPDEVLEFLRAGGSNFAVLNRVVKGGSTQFDGSLLGNQGHIIIVNPMGVVFGPSSFVQARRLTASSHDITNENFLNGRYIFEGGNGMVANYGEISAEMVELIGQKVLNAGIIRTPDGFTLLAAGDKIVLSEDGSDILVELASVNPSESSIEGIGDVVNEGSIEALGGKIVMAAGDTFSRAISGLDEVKVAVDGGTGRVGQFGTADVSSQAGDAGEVIMTAADSVVLGEESVTKANAGENGDGGEIIAYSPETAIVGQGALLEAKGGSESGDGGFVEISGLDRMFYDGDVDTTAANGEMGTLLFDPWNIRIVEGSGADDDSELDFQSSWFGLTQDEGIIEAGDGLFFGYENFQISEDKLESLNTNIILEALNDITMADFDSDLLDLSNMGGNGKSLTLTADADNFLGGDFIMEGLDDTILTNGGNININAHNIFVSGLTTASSINSDATAGNISLTAKGNITTNGEINAGEHLEMLGGQGFWGSSININENITAGSMRIKNGKDSAPGEDTMSGIYLAEDKDLTTTDGDMILQAVHDIILQGDISAAGHVYLNADENGYGIPGEEGYTPISKYGGDLITKNVSADGKIFLFGNAIKMYGDTTSTGDDIVIIGRTSKDSSGSTLIDNEAFGNVYSMGQIQSAGDVLISATGAEYISGYSGSGGNNGNGNSGTNPGGGQGHGNWNTGNNGNGLGNYLGGNQGTNDDTTGMAGKAKGGGDDDGDGTYVFSPGQIHLHDNVTADGSIVLYNDTYTYNHTGQRVTLGAGQDVVLKNDPEDMSSDNATLLQGTEILRIIAGNEIVAYDTLIQVLGSELTMQQGLTLDTADYMFGNQGDTDLTLISDSESVISNTGDNAANRWRSIGAHANQDIILDRSYGKKEITLGDSGTTEKSLWAENGNIEIGGFNVENAPANSDWDLKAGNELNIEVIHGIDLGGNLYSGARMSLKADTDKRYGHDVKVAGDIDSQGELYIEGTNVNISNAHSTGNMYIYAHGLYGTDNAPDEPLIGSGDVYLNGELNSQGHIELRATDFGPGSATTGPTFESPGDKSYSADGKIYAHDNITAAKDAIFYSDTIADSGVVIKAGDDIHIGGNDDTTSGSETAYPDIDSYEAKDITGNGDLTLIAGEATENDDSIYGNIAAGGDVITIGDLSMAGERVVVGGNVDATVCTGGSIEITVNDEMTPGGVSDSDVEVFGNITAKDEIVIKSGDNVNVGGNVKSNESYIDITANNDGLRTGGIEIGGNVTTADSEYGDIALQVKENDGFPSEIADGDVIVYQEINSAKALDVGSQQGIIFLKGDVTAKKDISLTAGGDENNENNTGIYDIRVKGKMQTTDGGNINVTVTDDQTGDYLNNKDDIYFESEVDSDGSLAVETGDDVFADGLLKSGSYMTINAGDDIYLNKSGVSADSAGDMTLAADLDPGNPSAGDVDVEGNLLSDGSIEISASDNTIYLAGDLVEAVDDVTLNNNVIMDGGHNQRIEATTGKVTTKGYVHKTTEGDLDIFGGYNVDDWPMASVWAQDDVTVDNGELSIKGNAIVMLNASIYSSGNMLLSANQDEDTTFGSLVHYGNTIESLNGDIDMSASNDWINLYGGKDSEYVTAGEDIILRDNVWVQYDRKLEAGDDVVLAGGESISANGSLDVLAGDDIILGSDDIAGHDGFDQTGYPGNVTSQGDLTLSAGDDIYAFGDISSFQGSIETMSSDFTTYLYENVYAFEDVTLHNTAILKGFGDQEINAGYFGGLGTLTADSGVYKMSPGNLGLYGDNAGIDAVVLNPSEFDPYAVTTCSGNINIFAENGDIQINGDLSTFGPCVYDEILPIEPPQIAQIDGDGEYYPRIIEIPEIRGGGGVSVIAKNGKIYTAGGDNDTLNIGINASSTLDGIGVQLPENYDGDDAVDTSEMKAAIVLKSSEDLNIGSGTTLTTNGSYDTTGTVDDRPGVDFLDTDVPDVKFAGLPIDVAIYLASKEGNLSVDATVNPIPVGGVMVFDAFDTVVPFGTNLLSSFAAGNVSWLEACSRITSTWTEAFEDGTLPIDAPGVDLYVMRGEDPDVGTGAWVLLEPGEDPALTESPFAGTETRSIGVDGCPAILAAASNELGVTEQQLKVSLDESYASATDIEACELCSRLVDSANVLQDENNQRMQAMANVFNQVVPEDAPFTPEVSDMLVTAFEENAQAGGDYATAREYIDAFVNYVAMVDRLGAPVEENDGFAYAMIKYGGELNESMASFISSRVMETQ